MNCPKHFNKLEGGFSGISVSRCRKVSGINECARLATEEVLAKAFTYCPNCIPDDRGPKTKTCKLIGFANPESGYWKEGVFCQKLGKLPKFWSKLSKHYSERISILNYNRRMVTGFGCAKNHVKKTGRLCGRGGLKSHIKVSGVECMYLCKNKPLCRSYTYSPTDRRCKLQAESGY